MKTVHAILALCGSLLAFFALSVSLPTACTEAPSPSAHPTTPSEQAQIERFVEPPLISIDLHRATLKQVADALGKATGLEFDAGPFAYGPDLHDLSMHNAPLWGVLAAIRGELPAALEDARDLHNPSPGTRLWTRAKGFAIIPQILWRGPNTADPKRPDQQVLFFGYNVLADPRIECIRLCHTSLTRIVDNRGNALEELPSPDAPAWRPFATFCRCGHILVLPPAPGTRIASAKGQLRFKLAFDIQTVELPNAQEHPNSTLKLAGHTIAIEGFNARDNYIRFAMRLDNRPRPNPPGSPLEMDPMISVSLIDATGANILPGENPSESTGAMMRAEFTPPLKFRATCPTRFAEVGVPFELKDLPF